MKDLKPIEHKRVILVEGNDDENLVQAFLNYLGISEIDIYNCEGKCKMFPRVLHALKISSNFSKVESLGIIRDANSSYKRTFRSVCVSLRSLGLAIPSQPLQKATGVPEISILILPHNSRTGRLEDVCLKSVQTRPEMSCVNQFFECLNSNSVQSPSDINKAKVKAYLSSQVETVPHLGVGALKGYWPYNSVEFQSLRQFLSNL